MLSPFFQTLPSFRIAISNSKAILIRPPLLPLQAASLIGQIDFNVLSASYQRPFICGHGTLRRRLQVGVRIWENQGRTGQISQWRIACGHHLSCTRDPSHTKPGLLPFPFLLPPTYNPLRPSNASHTINARSLPETFHHPAHPRSVSIQFIMATPLASWATRHLRIKHMFEWADI